MVFADTKESVDEVSVHVFFFCLFPALDYLHFINFKTKSIMKRLLSLSVCLMMAMLSFAHDFEVDNADGKTIYYDITSSSAPYTVAVTYRGTYDSEYYNEYTGDVTIPATVIYSGKTYSVTSIGDYAFRDCSGLTSVTIPNSVTSIGSYAFYGCSGLTSITIGNSVTSIGSYAFYGCSGLTSIEIPNSVTSIGKYAFLSCSGLTSVTIPNSVTSIGGGAFSGCSGLTSVTIPNSVTSIGSSAFLGCSGLTSITIPNNVTSIGDYAFSGCSGLTSINIPESVTSIGYRTFSGCKSLTSLIIPESVNEIGYESFNGCTLNALIIYSEADFVVTAKDYFTNVYTYTFTGLNKNSVIVCKSSRIDYIKEYYTGSVFPYDEAYSIDVTPYLKGFKIKISSNEYCEQEGSEIKVMFGDEEITPNENDEYFKDGLNPSTSYSVNISWKQGDEEKVINKNITTNKTNDVLMNISVGQTTANVQVTSVEDITYKIVERGVYVYRLTSAGASIVKIEKTTDSNSNVHISGLIPAMTYRFDAYVKYDDGTIVWYSEYLKQHYGKYNYYKYLPSYTTKGTNPRFITNSISYNTTTFKCKVSYDPGSLNVTYAKFEGFDTEDTYLHLTGLNPNTSYTIKFTVRTQEGSEETASYTFKTDKLIMTTEQPKVVSVGNVIVSAKANVDDAETNVGFEWRRTDWTDDFKSSTGTAYMYEGTMEGYIRNLNAEKLWKFRPYYLADDGTYYYGDWMGIDPTNTSYFEPTVHTYANINVEGNTALVKGYALGGTDKITVQGFKYWKAANLAPSGDLALEARKASPAIPANAQTIEAEGRVMEATLSGLDYECTYSYVAFAKTDEGTFYGEVKTFTTGPNTTGIEVVRDADSETKAVDDKVKGIFTLTGVKLSDDAADLKTLKRGIYIVNGRKVAVK